MRRYEGTEQFSNCVCCGRREALCPCEWCGKVLYCFYCQDSSPERKQNSHVCEQVGVFSNTEMMQQAMIPPDPNMDGFEQFPSQPSQEEGQEKRYYTPGFVQSTGYYLTENIDGEIVPEGSSELSGSDREMRLVQQEGESVERLDEEEVMVDTMEPHEPEGEAEDKVSKYLCVVCQKAGHYEWECKKNLGINGDREFELEHIQRNLHKKVNVIVTGIEMEKVRDIDDFSSLDLHSKLVENMEIFGYSKPTCCQQHVIPLLQTIGNQEEEDRDIIVLCERNSGRKFAFLCPLIQELLFNGAESRPATGSRKSLVHHALYHIHSIVITKTRKQCQEIIAEIDKFLRETNLKVCQFLPSVSFKKQLMSNLNGANILVCTMHDLLTFSRKIWPNFKLPGIKYFAFYSGRREESFWTGSSDTLTKFIEEYDEIQRKLLHRGHGKSRREYPNPKTIIMAEMMNQEERIEMLSTLKPSTVMVLVTRRRDSNFLNIHVSAIAQLHKMTVRGKSLMDEIEELEENDESLQEENERMRKRIEEIQLKHAEELRVANEQSERLKSELEKVKDLRTLDKNMKSSDYEEVMSAMDMLGKKDFEVRQHLRGLLRAKKKELEDLDEERRCKICFENFSNVILTCCGKSEPILCRACCEKLDTCPFCRAKFFKPNQVPRFKVTPYRSDYY